MGHGDRFLVPFKTAKFKAVGVLLLLQNIRSANWFPNKD